MAIDVRIFERAIGVDRPRDRVTINADGAATRAGIAARRRQRTTRRAPGYLGWGFGGRAAAGREGGSREFRCDRVIPGYNCGAGR